MIETEKEYKDTLDELMMTLSKVRQTADDAYYSAYCLRKGYGAESGMQSEADYFDLCEFMEDMEKHHKKAQKLLEKFYK